MPFKSKSQIAKFAEMVKQGKMTQAKFDEWMKSTPDAANLPEKVGGPVTSISQLKSMAKAKKI